MNGEIVVGCDGSRCAEAALRVAITAAKELNDRLILVFGDEPPGRSSGEEFRDHRRALDEMGTGLLEAAAAKARESGVEVETLLVPKKPHEALDGVARARGARMIVVGSYGEGPFRSAILGSTPHKLLHISETPILCVPA